MIFLFFFYIPSSFNDFNKKKMKMFSFFFSSSFSCNIFAVMLLLCLTHFTYLILPIFIFNSFSHSSSWFPFRRHTFLCSFSYSRPFFPLLPRMCVCVCFRMWQSHQFLKHTLLHHHHLNRNIYIFHSRFSNFNFLSHTLREK